MIAEKRSRRTAAPLETDSVVAPIMLMEDRRDPGGTAAITADAVWPPPSAATTTTGATTTTTTTTVTAEEDGSPPPSRNNNNAAVVVHLALAAGQVFFGFGSVVAALGLPACHPLAFALARESGAAVTLLAADRLLGMTVRRRRGRGGRFSEDGTGVHRNHRAPFLAPLRQHPARFALLGLAIFSNQAGNIVGIKLAGPVAAAVWQPSQPIITAALGMLCLRSEPVNRFRILGVVVAFLGCAVMVILSGRRRPPNNTSNGDGADSETEEDEDGTGMLMSLPILVGHVLFLINCTGTALYVILSKQVLAVYPSLQVTAWSYVIASAFMAATALAASSSDALLHFLCPDCPSGAPWWSIPPGAYGALAYFILFNSVAGYGIMTWANRHASGTLVIGYTVLQPVTAALAAVLLLGAGLSPRCDNNNNNNHSAAAACLDPPGWGTATGALGVFAGLYLVIVTEPPPPPPEDGGGGGSRMERRYSTVATNDDDDDDDDYSSGDDDGLLLEPSLPATDTNGEQ